MSGHPTRAARGLALALALAAGTSSFVALERSALAQKQTHEELSLAVGETKTMSAVGVKEFSEGVKGVVDVVTTPDGTRFVLTGKKPGSTTLLLIKNDGAQITYDISVAQRNPAIVEKEVLQLLEGMPGLRVRRVGGRIFIEGGVTTETDSRRVAQIAGLYPGQVESLVTVGQGGAGDRKLLIRLDFFFVQYDRNSSYAFGVGWPAQIGGATPQGEIVQSNVTYDFIAQTTTTAQAQVVNQPLPKLDVGARNGWLKVIKQSSVITANGAEANFRNGGEQNFLQNVGLTTSLVKVEFGTHVTVLPRYDAQSKDVEIKIGADVTDLTPPESGVVPGRIQTKLDTIITLKLGQALVLSGIKSTTTRRDIQGLPLLSEIPVLGVLFGTHRRNFTETEGAVFVVPSVVDTVPKSALELIQNALQTYRDYSGDLDKVDVFPKTPPSAK